MGFVKRDKQIPKQYPWEYIWLFAGVNKIGKTADLAAKFPKPYFAAWEPGMSAIGGYYTEILKEAQEFKNSQRFKGISEDKLISDWEYFEGFVDEFIANNGYGHKTLVIDPVAPSYDACSKQVMKELGISHPGDLDYGKGWDAINRKFKDVITKLTSNNFTVIFIAHTDLGKSANAKGEEISKVTLDVSGKAGKFLKNITDIFILCTHDENGERKMYCRPSTGYEAGSRIDLGTEAIEWGFEPLMERFNQKRNELNKQLGITEEDIKKYNEEQEKKRYLKKLLEAIREKAQNLNMKPEDIVKYFKVNAFAQIPELPVEVLEDFLNDDNPWSKIKTDENNKSENDSETIITNIKTIALEKKITPDEIAKRLGISNIKEIANVPIDRLKKFIKELEEEN